MSEEQDKYGNLISDLENGKMAYCCFPDCGCDGSRLCMAENGASERSCRQNVEGMYQRTDLEAVTARNSLIVDVMKEKLAV